MALTTAQQATLRAEINNDPKALGYKAYLPGSPGIVVNMLASLSDTMIDTIHSTTAQAWAAQGPMAKIVDAGNNTAHPCRASCLLVQMTLSSGSDIHLERTDVQQMFDAWLTQGVISQGWHDDLYARAKQPASRLQVLGLPPVDVYDLIAAGVVQ